LQSPFYIQFLETQSEVRTKDTWPDIRTKPVELHSMRTLKSLANKETQTLVIIT